MNTCRFFLVFFILSNNIFAQTETFKNVKCSDYNIFFNEAKFEFLNDKYQYIKTDSLVEKALNSVKNPLSVDLFFALKFYIDHCEKKKVLKITNMLLKNGVKSTQILNFKSKCIDKKEIRQHINNYSHNSINETASLLNEIHKSDQFSQYFFVSEKRRNEINELNFKKIESIIIKLKKWPSIKDTNRDLTISHIDLSSDYLQALLHFRIEQIDFLMPYLLDALNNNEISPYHFARIYDYYYIKKSAFNSFNFNNSRNIEVYQYFGVYKDKKRKITKPPVFQDDGLAEERIKKFCLLMEIFEINF